MLDLDDIVKFNQSISGNGRAERTSQCISRNVQYTWAINNIKIITCYLNPPMFNFTVFYFAKLACCFKISCPIITSTQRFFSTDSLNIWICIILNFEICYVANNSAIDTMDLLGLTIGRCSFASASHETF